MANKLCSILISFSLFLEAQLHIIINVLLKYDYIQ